MEREFYIKNKNKLVKKYLNKYIVIRGEKILGCYNSLGDAIDITSIDYRVGTFMVRKVLEKEEIIIF